MFQRISFAQTKAERHLLLTFADFSGWQIAGYTLTNSIYYMLCLRVKSTCGKLLVKVYPVVRETPTAAER